MYIHLICAARPNFMKIAPLYHALKRENWASPYIVHTGQHYDLNMSDSFFHDLNLPDPDLHLGIGSGSHAEQAGKVLISYEKALLKDKPDLVVVVGDVNSTMAATIAGSKLGVKIAHLEAGLRSYDRSMPEEINRIVTDVLADILWTPSKDAVDNLIKEGIPSERIHNVGNIMIDSLEMLREKIEKENVYKDFHLTPQKYGLVTFHRPSNVDDFESLRELCQVLVQIADLIPLVFPIHPRTKKNLEQNQLMQLLQKSNNLFTPDPMNYIHFMNLAFNCKFVITDSGGIQEETTYLGIPCLTVRPNTERPITISQGTNQLCKLNDLKSKVELILSVNKTNVKEIKFWDGKTSIRIVESIKNIWSI